MLWKTFSDKVAGGSGKSRNCETWRSFKFPAPGNFAANLSFLRTENLEFCPNCVKIPPGSGKGAAITGNFALIVSADLGYGPFYGDRDKPSSEIRGNVAPCCAVTPCMNRFRRHLISTGASANSKGSLRRTDLYMHPVPISDSQFKTGRSPTSPCKLFPH